MALDTNLVSYWKLDESSGNAADSVGSNTLTNNNTVTYATGKINNGADLESGSSQYFSITDGAQTGLGLTGNLSFSMWVKFESLPSSTYRGLITKKKASASFDAGYAFYLNHDGTNYDLFLEICNSNSQNAYHRWVTPTTGVWYHLAVTFTAASHLPTFYIDGVAKTTTSDGITNTAISTTTDSFQIGAYTTTNHHDGLIDEVGIWNRTLTAGEVSQLYSGNVGIQYPFTDVDNIIAFDASSSGSATATSLTYSHTCTGSNRLLYVSVRSDTAYPTGVTYSGVSMTNISQITNEVYIANYYLIAPATGANNVVVSFAGSNAINSVSASYTGVKQTGQPDASNTATTASGTSLAVSVTTVVDKSWVIGSLADNGAGVLSAGTNTVVRASVANNHKVLESTLNYITPAGSTTMNGNDSATGKITWLGTSFAPNAGTDYPLTAALGTFTLTGVDAGFPRLIKLTAAVGSFTLTGIDVIFRLGKGFIASVGEFILTGIDAAFRTSGWVSRAKNTSSSTEKTKNLSSWTEKDKNL